MPVAVVGQLGADRPEAAGPTLDADLFLHRAIRRPPGDAEEDHRQSHVTHLTMPVPATAPPSDAQTTALAT